MTVEECIAEVEKAKAKPMGKRQPGKLTAAQIVEQRLKEK